MKIFALTILFSFIIKLRFPKDKPTTTIIRNYLCDETICNFITRVAVPEGWQTRVCHRNWFSFEMYK